MQENEFFVDTKITKLETFSKEQLIQRIEVMDKELFRLVKENYSLRGEAPQPHQLSFVIEDQIASLQDQLYGSKSERYIKDKKDEDKGTEEEKKTPKPRVQKPSERYPNIPVIVNKIIMDPIPQCNSCGDLMFDSGLIESSQQITVIPKKFEIIESQRVIYKCNCQSCLITAPVVPKIKESSIYSDEMIIDVVLSKYCDLIPMERYAAMAARNGMMDLPPHSLIELSHYFAEFTKGVYLRIKDEALMSRVLRADETPHRMLEGSDKKSWYLWGFSTERVCFFECHGTRSGDVASEILESSLCEILVSDVYTGYNKAVRVANQSRVKNKKPLIKNAYCNAHSRRYFHKFWKLHKTSGDAQFYLDQYQEIYKLEGQSKGKSPPEILLIREQMRPYFESMKSKVIKDINKYPSSHQLSKAMGYFLDHYINLTRFLEDPEIPIDNNSQESLLRNPVVGRKTWYGTHSKLGAKTAAIIFTLVETCRLNDVNPREYFPAIVKALHTGEAPLTPQEYLARK